MKRIFLFSFCFLFGVISIAVYQYETVEQNKQIDRLTDLVKTGMTIDNARNILEQNGFFVGNELYPTGNKNHGLVHVKIFKKFNVIDNASELIGFSWPVGKGYVALEFDKNGIITNIGE